MPSIIEVDTIKNKTGTQNTVLSTDGSGNVTIANSTFTGTTNGTIGSNATFPAGHGLQVVDFETSSSDDDSSISTSNSQEWTDTNVKKTITTTVNNPDIYILGFLHVYLVNHSANDWNAVNIRLQRIVGGTTSTIWTSGTGQYGEFEGYWFARYTVDNDAREMNASPYFYFDTGLTANAGTSVEYKLEYATKNAYQASTNTAYGKSRMTLMEVMP